MTKRITSVIVIISLSLSIFFGGLGLSLRSAYADSITDTSEQQFDYFRSLVKAAYPGHDTDIDSFFDGVLPYVSDIEENADYLVLGMVQGNNYYFCMYQSTVSFSNLYYVKNQWGDWYGINTSNSTSRTSWVLKYRLCACESGFTCNLNISTNISSLSAGSFTFRWSNPFAVYGYIIPCPSTFNVSGCAFYSSKPISSGLWSRSSSSQNLLGGTYSSTFSYDLLVFWLGERRYLTIKDQALMRQLWGNDLMEYVLVIESPFDDQGDFDLISYQFHNTTLLQYSGVESQLENISPLGTYAIDITSLDWVEIHDSIIYDFVIPNDPELVGQSSNIPLILEEAAPEPGTSGTPDSYSNSWNTFITYINNYDSSQVIPDNLVDTIFGVNGFKLYPVDVSLPSSTIPSNNPVTTNIHTYKYHFGSLPSDIGLNYDLMDVCIIPKSLTGNYGLVFFYDDTLAAANKFVDYVDYKDLLEQFDLIIVIDDTFEALQENAWWEIIVPNDVWSHIDYMAVSGSSSLGIQYTSDPLPGNIESGFCIVTKRAIQRQQLYLFNDGITKSYKLMSDFVEKHGLWENSFFEWSQSIFYELQTIGGKTNDIYNLLVGLNLGDVLDNINRQLERIADNTSEEDPGYWFLSLFNFISRFSVSDLDFANWVENYDDFESQIPLPNEDVTPIPIPTITSEVG